MEELKLQQLLSRGVEAIYPSREELVQRLKNGPRLAIFCGIDPTGPSLHLGHASILLKLREFADLGHKITVLIGDFTAMIGDPTDKLSTRKKLSAQEVAKNYRQYKKQISKILPKVRVSYAYNNRWFKKMKMVDVLDLASEFTTSQMLERDMFQERVKSNQPIFMNELFYPLLQGYDSVALNIDMEIGGNDQTFNMLVGRTLLKRRGKDKYVISLKLLADPSGKKMGKTDGNAVFLDNQPNDIYGKVMSWSDDLVPIALEIITLLSPAKITDILKLNPRDAKMALACEITTLCTSKREAKLAEEYFITTVQKKEIPADVLVISVIRGSKLVDILEEQKLIETRSEFKRLVLGGGVMVNEKKINDLYFAINEEVIVKIGKRKFIKLKIK